MKNVKKNRGTLDKFFAYLYDTFFWETRALMDRDNLMTD